MKCEICHKGPPNDPVTLFRVNEKGVKGIWRCTEHLTRSQSTAVDPEVRKIVGIIEDDNRRKQP